MKDYLKTAMIRGIFGIFIGLAIGYTVFTGIILAHGELNVVAETIVFNYGMAVIVGFYMGAISIVYDVEEWSILRQTTTHGLMVLPYVPFAFVVGWAPPTLGGRLLFILFYILVYMTIWLSIRAYWKKRVVELNKELAKLDKKPLD